MKRYILPVSFFALLAAFAFGAEAATFRLGDGQHRPDADLNVPPIEVEVIERKTPPTPPIDQGRVEAIVDDIIRDAEIEADRVVEEAIEELREDTDFPYDAWQLE